MLGPKKTLIGSVYPKRDPMDRESSKSPGHPQKTLARRRKNSSNNQNSGRQDRMRQKPILKKESVWALSFLSSHFSLV